MAEKLEAMVQLGMVNSRMKDVHDIWTLAREQPFEGATLCRSLAATFQRRRTPIPREPPLALTEEFSRDASRASLWSAFLGRVGLEEPRDLREAIDVVAGFVWPPLSSVAQGDVLNRHWEPGGPWRRMRR